jgi:hypothetical protein
MISRVVRRLGSMEIGRRPRINLAISSDWPAAREWVADAKSGSGGPPEWLGRPRRRRFVPTPRSGDGPRIARGSARPSAASSSQTRSQVVGIGPRMDARPRAYRPLRAIPHRATRAAARGWATGRSHAPLKAKIPPCPHAAASTESASATALRVSRATSSTGRRLGLRPKRTWQCGAPNDRVYSLGPDAPATARLACGW